MSRGVCVEPHEPQLQPSGADAIGPNLLFLMPPPRIAITPEGGGNPFAQLVGYGDGTLAHYTSLRHGIVTPLPEEY